MEKRFFSGIIVFLLVVLPAIGAVEVTTPDGRIVRLNDDYTWEYVGPSDAEIEWEGDALEEAPEVTTFAVLQVIRKRELPNGCRFGVTLRNDLGFKIKSLVPQFSAYMDENIVYQTVSRGFFEIKPTNSQYGEIHFSRIKCDQIAFVMVHGADHCTMGPYTKFSAEPGECLDRIKVEPSEYVDIRKQM